MDLCHLQNRLAHIQFDPTFNKGIRIAYEMLLLIRLTVVILVNANKADIN